MEDDKVVRLERQWLSVDELAAREGVTPRTVYRWLKAGKVEAREDGDTTRYRRCHDAPTETRDQAQDKPGNASDMRGDGDLARHLLDALEQAQARELALTAELGELRAENRHLLARVARAEAHPLVRVFSWLKRLLDGIRS